MLDKETLKQIKQMIQHPTIDKARIMHDCHKGVECCIGFTSKLANNIIPNFIGRDIGCGILTYPFENITKGREKKIIKIEKTIRDVVPMGTGPNVVFCRTSC